MTQADDRILETLEASGLRLSPRVLAENTDYTGNYVSKRLKILLDKDLVERVDEGLYQISTKGSNYLSGDISAEELERDRN